MDDRKLIQLADALGAFIITSKEALPIIIEAHINPAEIPWENKPYVWWFGILQYAKFDDRLDELITALLRRYPRNPHLLAFKEDKLQEYNLGPDIKSQITWKEDKGSREFEKIIEQKSTLLPIRFLAQGLEKANAVARIVIEKTDGNELATGFLIKDNQFVTNNHVINNIEYAKKAKIQFKFEESIKGLVIQHDEFVLDPDQGFETSVDDDWTIIKIKGNPNEKYGALTFSRNETRKNDFVNIIQHPAGRYKEIGLYHNVVTYCDKKIVQYLTDTEPGSSGSPVFNSSWEVIAIHHSGGSLREPDSTIPLLRNEGINIQVLPEKYL